MLMISAKRYGYLTAVERADGTSKAEVSDLPD